MKGQRNVVLAAMILAGVAVLAFGGAAGGEEVHFPDADLEAAVRERLEIPPPTPITDVDMLQMPWLSASGDSIGVLTGLEYATNLEDLRLSSNEISDLWPISQLPALATLYVWDNEISDLSPLAGLLSLGDLWLQRNQISDISPLSGLTNLHWLFLAHNRISDVSPLSGLNVLGVLHLDSNQIADVAPLDEMDDVWELSLIGNLVSDISPLAGMESLEYLHVYLFPQQREAYEIYIPMLLAAGVHVHYDPMPIPGDTDGSGAVDGNDINPFVLALTDRDAYMAAYHLHPDLAGDVDGDGVLDGNDINAFVDLLVTGGSPAIPEPTSALVLAAGLSWLIKRRSGHESSSSENT